MDDQEIQQAWEEWRTSDIGQAVLGRSWDGQSRMTIAYRAFIDGMKAGGALTYQAMARESNSTVKAG
jgi:hypothetical protein